MQRKKYKSSSRLLRRFPTFLAVLESKYSGGNTLDTMALTEAIEDLYQIYMENVVKKVYIFLYNMYTALTLGNV